MPDSLSVAKVPRRRTRKASVVTIVQEDAAIAGEDVQPDLFIGSPAVPELGTEEPLELPTEIAGWLFATAENEVAAMQEKLSAHAATKGHRYFISETVRNTYRFVGLASASGQGSRYVPFLGSVARFALSGARIIAKQPPSRGQESVWSVDIEWAPDYATRPIVREYREMDFVGRLLAKALTEATQGSQKRWNTHYVNRVVSAVDVLAGLSKAGEDPVFAQAAAILRAMAKGDAEIPIDLPVAQAVLMTAGGLVKTYVDGLEAAIQSGQVDFDDVEPSPAQAPTSRQTVAPKKIDIWAPGESETDRFYRALDGLL